MKTFKLFLALALVLSMFSGCANRNNNNVTSTPSASGTLPDLIEDAEDGIEDLVSDFEDGVEDFISDFDRDDDMSGYDDDTSTVDEYPLPDTENSMVDDLLDDESVAAAMSTDFSEIGALSAEKLGWGSGGPTDDTGRPNGATHYQDKYGEHDAFFIAPSSQNVYLTFDEGYENGYTPAILDTLKKKDAKAVFFITLDFAQRQPELVKRMLDEGHVLGNHSCKHLSFPTMSLEDAAQDILKLHQYVKDNYGYEMTLFRPPMGEFSEQTLALAKSLGYRSVFWSFAYMDYDVDNQPLYIEAMDTITNKCHPGAIYLLHAVSKTNAEVLGESIDAIRELGFTIAPWDL